MVNINETLKDRGSSYGNYLGQAMIAMYMKDYFRTHTNWNDMKDDQKDCLDMIAVKISRILNGDPNVIDSWHDIAGYATLVANRLNEKRAANSIEETEKLKMDIHLGFRGGKRYNQSTGKFVDMSKALYQNNLLFYYEGAWWCHHSDGNRIERLPELGLT